MVLEFILIIVVEPMYYLIVIGPLVDVQSYKIHIWDI